MTQVSTYLNFSRNTEEAFSFYKSIFHTEFKGPVSRFGDMPPQPGMPPLAEADKNLVMHVELPITSHHSLMGSDAPESFGMQVHAGNNVHIALETDTREEAARLFNALSAGGHITMLLQEMFWGAYYGSCTDQYGIQWMFNCYAK